MRSRLAIPALAVVVLSGLIPNVWPISVHAMVAVTFWLGMEHTRRMVFLLTVPALAVLGFFALISEPSSWQGSLMTALILMAAASQVNEAFQITARRAEEAQRALRRQAETDALTGLANRSSYVATLEERLAEGRSVAVMIMDLNRFKTINDTLGHSVGDEVLVLVAGRLGEIVEAPNLVARLGGDEFAVIAEAVSADDAQAFAAELGDAVSTTMQLSGMSISTTISCGIAMAPDHGSDSQALMRHADIAMYEAKRRGRTLELFNNEIEQTPIEEVTLSASLKQALAGDQFVLHYQPKVQLATGRITGFEALSRWEHPTLGLLGPDRFIHLVTLSDENQAFADRIIELGVQFAVECRDRGNSVPVAVNLSARSLFDDTLPDRTAHLLRSHDLDPSLLIIEITEADIMDEAGHNSRVLSRLSELGVKISIDDFGTGYSSLARLVDLPISEVKIDKHFVHQSLQDRRDEVIVRSIVELAETLDLHIVAEGVENRSEVNLLLSAGCDEAQGYLFSPAIPLEEALDLLDMVFPFAYRTSVPPEFHPIR
ncbi:MAG: EAL domain-containing protein [Actinomycetota bacterium]